MKTERFEVAMGGDAAQGLHWWNVIDKNRPSHEQAFARCEAREDANMLRDALNALHALSDYPVGKGPRFYVETNVLAPLPMRHAVHDTAKHENLTRHSNYFSALIEADRRNRS